MTVYEAHLMLEDMEAMSQTAREVWLAEQCSMFESELRKLSEVMEKENLVEELYKKLKQVTRRWQSWNHRSFGGVTSRGYVMELNSWEHNVKSRGLLLPKIQNITSPDTNVLGKFEDWCRTYEDLLKQFTKGIYGPLQDFFLNEKMSGTMKGIPKELDKILKQWAELLSAGVINERLFSSSSGEKVYPVVIRNRCHEFDHVLRLVPDLLEKAYESLRLARRWRLVYRSSSLPNREQTYIVPKDLENAQRSKRSRVLQRIKTLEMELEQSQAHYQSIVAQLQESNARCEAIESELTNYRQQSNQLENELDSVKKKCEDLKQKLDKAKKENENSNAAIESSAEYIKVLQKELNGSKMKFCVQKIKFINAKRHCSELTKGLETAKDILKSLEAELAMSKKKCDALKVQLENAKKNVFTQGNMLDVLQNQCFSLREELEGSRAKCTELSCELGKSQDKCHSLMKELELVKDQCHNLSTELRRAKTREELLIKQNEQLRAFCQGNECYMYIYNAQLNE
ncbi:hypothetical protein QZH41_019722 [Actinostola sp. cb2023]|nr:hypothetical protein QZH41_019722 [Actinostola sp. cb2023]